MGVIVIEVIFHAGAIFAIFAIYYSPWMRHR